MATDVMIQANGLTKRFGVVRALDKVNFEVKRGEVVGFLGPNGAGKSTTMRILTCFISPSTGSATVNSHDVFDNPLEVRRSIGYLPQRAPLYTDMTVWEVLEVCGRDPRLDESTFKKRLRRWSKSAAWRNRSAKTSPRCRMVIASAWASAKR